MTSRYHSSKILDLINVTDTAACIVERWKKSMGYRFVPGCNRAQESRACQCFKFFLPYLQGRVLLRSRNFATMATSRNDLSPFYNQSL